MRRLNLLYLLLMGMFFTACHSDDDTWGDWSKDSEFPGQKRVLAFCFKYDEAAYIGMGYNQDVKEPDKNLRDFWRFDGRNWTRLPDFPVEGRQGSVAFVIGDTAYVGAGIRGKYTGQLLDKYFDDFYKFDLKKNEWVKKSGSADYDITSISASSQIKKEDCSFWAGVGFSLNGKGYAGTGNLDGYKESKLMFCYDPATGGWTTGSIGDGDSRAGAVVFTIKNKVVLCLGTGSGQYVKDVVVFDGTNWEKKRPLQDLAGGFNDDYGKIPRSYAVAFTSDLSGGFEKGYICGGQGNGKTAWEYNLEEDRWYEVTEFRAAMNSLRIGAVGFSLKQYGYVTTGGASLSQATDNSTWKFTPGVDEDENNDY